MRAIGLLLATALLCGGVNAAVPHQINYQGYLTATGGAPVNTMVSMAFNLYDVSIGGAALYTETQTVTVTNGVFNVAIGSITAMPLPFDVPYYLGIKVGADPEMTPRQALAASAYAIRSATTDALAPTATVAAAQLPALTGDVTTTAGSATTTLADANASPGTFGDGTHVGRFTVNSKGLITGATNVSITGATVSGTASGDLAGSYPGPTVAQVGGVTAANVATGANLANAASSGNTPNTLVKRDASGNFVAGTIAGNLTGNVTGNVFGNATTASAATIAATATKLITARSINGVGFDGTADIVVPAGVGPPGPSGADGANGVDAFTTIAGTFTQPAANGNTASLTVGNSSWMAVGQAVFVGTGGYYAVASKPDATHVVLTNLGYAGNTVPGTTTNGGPVSPAGLIGPTGTSTITAATATNITGLLKGNGTMVSAAIAGADFVAPNAAITGATNTKITYDAKGLVTAGAQAQFADLAGSLAASQLPALTGDVTTPSGSAATTLATVNNTAGQFGSSTQVAQLTVNAKGLVTAAQNVTIAGAAPSGPASGDLSGSYPGPTVSQVSGVTAANVAAAANLANAATAANTPNTIVRRDASGNLVAGTITGNLSGNVLGNVTGNATTASTAATATKLATARSINGTAFDGTADISLPISGTITGTFTQPAVNSNTASLAVSSSAWMIVGQVVFVATGGYYRVFSTPDATHAVLTNLGSAGNAAPSTTGNGGAISPAGPVGAGGFKSLIAMSTEPAGNNCAYGGTKVTSGLDLDSSGSLDPGEVSATSYVCNGSPYAVVPVVPPGCGTQPLSLGTPFYVSPAGLGGAAYRGDAVTFSVTVTDPNTCSSVTVASNYIWTLVSKPLGSTATLSNTNAASPTLVADVAGGTYQLSVQVIDTLGNKSPTAYASVNVSACGAQPPVISSTSARAHWPKTFSARRKNGAAHMACA